MNSDAHRTLRVWDERAVEVEPALRCRLTDPCHVLPCACDGGVQCDLSYSSGAQNTLHGTEGLKVVPFTPEAVNPFNLIRKHYKIEFFFLFSLIYINKRNCSFLEFKKTTTQ